MTISTADNLIAAISNGRFYRCDWNKQTLPTTAQAAGQWYDLSQGFGNPSVNAIIGSSANLAHQAVSDTTSVTATTAATSGNITTTVFTDTTHNTGRFTVGMMLSGSGVTPGTYITSLGTGTGANSGATYNINISQSVTSQTITGTAYANSFQTGGVVSTNIKNLVDAHVFTLGATSAPAVMMLYDMLAVYTISSVTTTGAQSFTGQTAWPRYANGVGVRAFLVANQVMGIGTPTVQLSYTNPGAVSGQNTPAAPSLPTLATTAPVGMIPYSGTGAGKFGPFLPLVAGDQGIKSVESINFSATMTSGCMNLVICKPLITLPLTSIGVAGERDYVNQLPSMPVIQDGACLNWLMYAGAATPISTNFWGNFDFAWG